MPGARRLTRAGRVVVLAGLAVVVVGLTSCADSEPESGTTRAPAPPNRESDPAEQGLERLRHESVALRGPACVAVPAGGRGTVVYAISATADAPRTYRMRATGGGVRVRGVPSRITLQRGATRRVELVVVARSSAAAAADPFVQLDAVSLRDPADAQTASTEIAIGPDRHC